MGTRLEIRAFGERSVVERAIEDAFDRVGRLERAMTTWDAGGELSGVNRALSDPRRARSGVALSADLAGALDEALEWSRRTAGLYDPTVGALTEAWGLRRGGRAPGAVEVREALSRTGAARVRLAGQRLRADPGTSIDLGGIGKGIALDEAATVLQAAGVRAALLDFGGQVLALGAPPDEPGWIVAIAHPLDRDRPVLALRLARASLATSGNAERAITAGGRRHGHLLDPRTGGPVDTDATVSVVATDATAADALATALLVAGPSGAEALAPVSGASWVFLVPGPAGVVDCATGGAPWTVALEAAADVTSGCRAFESNPRHRTGGNGPPRAKRRSR